MVLAFGEILLRLSPQLGGVWIKEETIPTFIGGAELNVATALSGWKVPVGYSSAMPDNAISLEIRDFVNSKGIDTRKVLFSGNRIGTYYLPQGADLKNAGVIYDRAYSSFSELKKEDMDWDSFFSDVTWFHITAISPALNQTVAELCTEAAKQAQSRGITVSLDLNYRAKLWKYGKNPAEIMPQIARHCDLIMGNIWAANTLLGIELDKEVAVNNANKEQYLAHARQTSEAIKASFPNVKAIANTFRFDAFAEGIEYYSTLYTENGLVVSREFSTKKVIDKVGSGDCFMAGLIYGFYNKKTDDEIINFAAAAAFGKLNEKGDATRQTVDDVLKLM